MTTNDKSFSNADILEEIDAAGERLSKWEIDFIESITKALRRGDELTQAQRAKLQWIHEERVP